MHNKNKDEKQSRKDKDQHTCTALTHQRIPIYDPNLDKRLDSFLKFSTQTVPMIERELLLGLKFRTHLDAPLNQCLKGLKTANPFKSFLLP